MLANLVLISEWLIVIQKVILSSTSWKIHCTSKLKTCCVSLSPSIFHSFFFSDPLFFLVIFSSHKKYTESPKNCYFFYYYYNKIIKYSNRTHAVVVNTTKTHLSLNCSGLKSKKCVYFRSFLSYSFRIRYFLSFGYLSYSQPALFGY